MWKLFCKCFWKMFFSPWTSVPPKLRFSSRKTFSKIFIFSVSSPSKKNSTKLKILRSLKISMYLKCLQNLRYVYKIYDIKSEGPCKSLNFFFKLFFTNFKNILKNARFLVKMSLKIIFQNPWFSVRRSLNKCASKIHVANIFEDSRF